MKHKYLIGTLVSIFLIIAINSLWSNKPFCKGDKYKLTGSACWPINYYTEQRIEARGADGKGYLADFKIPFFLLRSQSYTSNGAHGFIPLELKIIFNSNNAKEQYYESTVNFFHHILDDGHGLVASAEQYKNTERYLKTEETELFNVYQNFPVSSGFKYLVPKNQPTRYLYVDCIKNCVLHSSYKKVAYEIFMPAEWIDDYLILQKIMELLIDSTVVKVE